MTKPAPQYRTDTLVCPLNAGKLAKVRDLVTVMRKIAEEESDLQWRRFYRGGWQGFESMATKGWSRPWVEEERFSVTHAQMVMAQVAGQLKGHWGNVKNRYTKLVSGSSLPANIRHQLHSINARSLWFSPHPVKVKQDTWQAGGGKGGKLVRKSQVVVVADEIRALAKTLIRRAMDEHRKPRFHRYQFQLDQRTVFVQDPHTANGFGLWLTMGTLVPGERIALPLETHPYFLKRQDRALLDRSLAKAGSREDRIFQAVRAAADLAGSSSASGEDHSDRAKQEARIRKGLKEAPERNPHASRFALAKSIRLILSPDGQSLSVAVATDMGATHAHSAATYKPKMDALALDLGGNTLFGTDLGDLLGRNWFRQIERYDRLLQSIARHRQRLGLKTASPRYRKIAAKLKGFLKTEINRILNRLVKTHAPSHFVMEEPGFYRNPRLSKRLNRLMSNMGITVLNEKLKDLEDRFGITTIHVPAAYSSKSCSVCGYVDSRNRPSQDTFCCKFCNTQLHADVNAPRNLLARRSGQPAKPTALSGFEPRRSRKQILQDLVGQFLERYPRPRGGSSDPRLSNPYFRAWAVGVRSAGTVPPSPSPCSALA